MSAAGGAITRLEIGADSTRQQRLAWLMWQNRELINWYIGQAIAQMPPLLRGLIRIAGKQLGVSVETQFGPALVAFVYQLPPDQFRQMWIELGTMFRWAGEGAE